MSSSRFVAAQAVCKVAEDGAYSNIILNSLLMEYTLNDADKALCTAIFYGTLDRMVTIDFYLKKLIKTTLKKIKPYTLAVLRTAIYQIKYLDKIPESAAVNEAVKLIKNSNEAYNASFVNGVLRNLIRTDIPLPTGNSIYDISVAYSCPQWIATILLRDYGVEFTKSFLSNALLPPPTFIKVNTVKTNSEKLVCALSQEGITVTESVNSLKIQSSGTLENLNAYKKGLFYVQDLSCQQAVEMLDIKPDSRVLDLCAAPGGKSFTAALTATEGSIISCDLYEHRAGLILKGAQRLGLDNITVKVSDAACFDDELGLFDRIICDVPCSGFGVIRRKPDIKYKHQDNFEELINIQQKILNNSVKYLKLGGKILYSTCTLNKAENRGNIDQFLAEHKDFSLEIEKSFSPQDNNTDGFYAAILVKN